HASRLAANGDRGGGQQVRRAVAPGATPLARRDPSLVAERGRAAGRGAAPSAGQARLFAHAPCTCGRAADRGVWQVGWAGLRLLAIWPCIECASDMRRNVPMPEKRKVKLFRKIRNQAVCIPVGFELPGYEAIMQRDGDRLVIEPVCKRGLIATLKA